MTAVRDCGQTERIHAFAGGELTGDAADDVRDHLATCVACQAELTEVLQLDAAVIDRTAGVVSLAWYRQRRVQLAAVALAVAASAAIYLALPHRGAPVAHDAVAVVLAPRRAIEARLAWPGARDAPRCPRPRSAPAAQRRAPPGGPPARARGRLRRRARRSRGPRAG
jgi:hypothetical protein